MPDDTPVPSALAANAPLTVRRAGPDDAGAVRELTRAAYARWVPIIGREPRPMQADYEHAVRAHRIDLFHLDGSAVALIETVAAPDHLMIENIAVLPALQGFGLGPRLVAHAEALARDLGLTEMRLYTNKAMVANIRLYQRLGFQVEREEPFALGIAVHMRKTLPPRLVCDRAASGLAGGCLCGAVRYRIERLDGPIVQCHCATCRKAHAAGVAATAGVLRTEFHWTAGEDQLAAYESSPGKLRRFCVRCGSHLLAERPAQPHVILRVATLDDDPGVRPAMHIWTAHDVPWLTADAGVPRYPGWPPGR